MADDPEPGVSVLRPSGRWDLASHPLGETTDAVYVGHYENHNPGHSPWLHFAKRLKREARRCAGGTRRKTARSFATCWTCWTG